MDKREEILTRLSKMMQPVPREDYEGGWVYQGDEGILTPAEHLRLCESVADDDEALNHLSQSKLHEIVENDDYLYDTELGDAS